MRYCRLKRGFYKCILVSMVMLHVIIALVSIILATYSLFKPTRQVLIADWILVAATVVSGTTLVALEPTRMLHACIAGLIYVMFASTLTLIARVRYISLRKQNNSL